MIEEVLGKGYLLLLSLPLHQAGERGQFLRINHPKHSPVHPKRYAKYEYNQKNRLQKEIFLSKNPLGTSRFAPRL